MSTSGRKLGLLIVMAYAFFTCFLMNVFGYALSYDKLIYEWNILNIHEGRKAVFNAAILHFGIFTLALLYYFRRKLSKHKQFQPVHQDQAVSQEQAI